MLSVMKFIVPCAMAAFFTTAAAQQATKGVQGGRGEALQGRAARRGPHPWRA